MKEPHLLRVEEPPERFAVLITAARAAGLRVGWLDLDASPPPPPPHLAAAVRSGALRAVSAASSATGGSQVVAVKTPSGGLVFKDLLREHFLGCRLVLVAVSPGAVPAVGSGLLPPGVPRLRSRGEGWYLEAAGEAGPEHAEHTGHTGHAELSTAALVARLARPRLLALDR